MPPGTPTTPAVGTPDWLAAAAKLDGTAAEPERIALRTSAPPATAPKPAAPAAPKPRPEIAEAVAAQPVTKPAKPAPAKAPKKEKAKPEFIDVAFYPSRLMIPETVTLAVIAVGWVMFVMPLIPAQFQTLEVYASVPGAIALFQGVRWLFRVAGGGYKLTGKQLLRSLPGPIPDPEPIELSGIGTVAVLHSPWEWLMLAGRLKLSFERDAQPAIELGPVSWPGRRAETLRKAIEAARSGNVISGRLVA